MMVSLWVCLAALSIVEKTANADAPDPLDAAIPPASTPAKHTFYGIRGEDSLDDLLDYIKTMRDPSSKRAYNTLSGKRASAGFHGMRGKKWYNLDYDTKRASAGFHGMRGKKDFEETNEDELAGYQDAAEAPAPCDQYECGGGGLEEVKRGSAGFHGMRGKKETEWSLKRAMGFLGMRGKKMSPLSLNL